MSSNRELIDLFFYDLHKYNSTNFKAIAEADLSVQDASVYKAFSSAVTRYFIFRERHPEISNSEHNLLYFLLKLDLVARYFSEYPDANPDSLVAFQLELRNYIKERRGETNEESVAV